MLPFAYYLLKVLICSGLLFGYYWFALRNKRFHNYNRFYLLAAVVLSWTIPLLKLDFWNETDQNPQIIKLLTVVSGGDSYMEKTAVTTQYLDWNGVALLGYILLSGVFLVIFLSTLYRILKLIRTSQKEKLNKIHFIFSDAKDTPFTFFRYIFWNNNIDIHAEAGKSILRHELVHVSEKHSADKLFINIVLIVGWYNPFFLLIRKELNMLHELIADQKAFAEGDTSAFALMILNASYANHSGTLTQSFFHSPIKRRLLMLTKSKHPRYSYLRRVMVLPLVFIVFVFFAFRLKENKNSSQEQDSLYSAGLNTGSEGEEFSDTTKRKSNGQVTVVGYGDSSFKNALPNLIILDGKKMTLEEFKKQADLKTVIHMLSYGPNAPEAKMYGDEGKTGVAIVTTKPDANKIPLVVIPRRANGETVDNLLKVTGETPSSTFRIRGGETTSGAPMFLYDNKVISQVEFNAVNPNDIESVTVLKEGPAAVEKFGEKAANGVIMITSKQKKGDVKEVTANPLTVTGYKLRAEGEPGTLNMKSGKNEPNREVVVTDRRITEGVAEVPVTSPLYFYDGKLMTEAEFKKLNISAEDIKSVTVYKGEHAVKTFGDKAVNGVVEVSVAQKPLSAVQATDPEPKFDRVFTAAENPPYYEYGMAAFAEYFDTHVQYPAKALENKIEGSVSIQFIVDENGKLSNFKKLSSKGYGLEEEAIRLLKNSGNWKPAVQNGHKVPYQVQQLIVFVLPGKQAL